MRGTNDTDDVTFKWSNVLSSSNISSAVTVTTSGRYLHFIPLQQQHEGMYICTATVNGATKFKSTNLSVNSIQLKVYTLDFQINFVFFFLIVRF